MNEKMRRKDRETTEERAYEILKNGEYGILPLRATKFISIALRIRV